MKFLNRKARPWAVPDGGRGTFADEGYYLGQGSTPLEVAVASAPKRPSEADVRNLWKRRKGGQPSPLLLVVLWGDRATVCGATGEDPAVYSDRDPAQVARIADLALSEPDHHAALRLLTAYLPGESDGLRNVSLFATHHLTNRIPVRVDWADLCTQGMEMLGLRRERLVEALGFKVEPKGHAAVLREHGNARALAVFLDDSENPDQAASRFNGMTPASWAIASACADNIPYVVLTRGTQLRVYTTRTSPAAGSKGGTSSFLELNLPLLTSNDAGYLPLLFSADSLQDGGEFETLLAASHDFSVDLGSRLRNRVYDHAVPHIAAALISNHGEVGGGTDPKALAGLYERSLLVLFRLMFVAYSEDRNLLPLDSNGLYRQRSLKRIARELAELANTHGFDSVPFDTTATDYWDNVRTLWTAVDEGRREWNVPRYNGGFFSTDPEVNKQGAALTGAALTNAEFGPALLGLLVDDNDDGSGYGPVDFASLDIREFGTIYEGLLESDLALAPNDLTVNKDGAWIPAGPKSEVLVSEGDVYLHNKSGSRKASGSYFTKPFAVTHLLDHALEPSLDAHIERLTVLMDAGDEVGAAEAFFDFRCVDLSMGSGHFLVAAVDRIENRLSRFLKEHRVGGVLDELSRLATEAEKNLAEAGVIESGADTNTLLRRQVARRCLYGTDLNATSVELARLALWIHTFVKGLPLTSLNHGLVVGNSLTGIGTLDEAIDVLDPERDSNQPSFIRMAIIDALEQSRVALTRFAATSEANASEVKEARKAHAEASKAVESVEVLFDLAVAARLGRASVPVAFDAAALVAAANASGASDVASELDALHFPVQFPEVFLRDRPGFDCIIGNPPWEEATVEELSFFALRQPGLKSMRPAEQKREIRKLRNDRPDLEVDYDSAVDDAALIRSALIAGPYPGMGTGDPDLYKAFCWRFWHLLRPDGAIGVVLPRGALSASGSTEWRKAVLDGGAFEDVTMLYNAGFWVFDDMDNRKALALLTVRKGRAFVGDVTLRGPFRDMSRYLAGMEMPPAVVTSGDIRSWTDTASVPLFPTPESVPIFLTMRQAPRFDSAAHPWTARPVTELHATNEKKVMKFGIEPDGDDSWPVYKGASFDIWNPDTGTYYAASDRDTITGYLSTKRVRQQKLARSAFSAFGEKWAKDKTTLPCLFPRIAFRDIANRTNIRTVIPCLIPPDVVVTNKAPYLLWSRGDERDQAFVLGVMSSIPLDWYARRVVELNLNFHISNALPIPNPAADDPLRALIVESAGRLAAADDRFSVWAKAVGVEVATVSSKSDREALEATIDAAVAHLYGLSTADVEHIFETFHEGWEYDARLQRTLAEMNRLT